MVNRNINIDKNNKHNIKYFLIFDLFVSNGSSMNDAKNKHAVRNILVSRIKSFIMIVL